MVNTSIKKNLKITNEKAGTKDTHKGLKKRHYNGIRFIEKYISKNKNIYILDAGCREGLFLKKLQKNGYKNLYGIDISEKAINLINDPNKIIGYVGDICTLPFDDNMFDLIICTHTLEHCEFPELALNEFYRVLKNNGLVLLEVPIENVETPRINVGHFSSFKTEEHFIKFASKHFNILGHERDSNTNKHWFRVIARSKKE